MSADSSQQLLHAVHVFGQAARDHPHDADTHIALGVLQHLAQDFDGAVASFRKALELKSDDYSLWNKLGATLVRQTHASPIFHLWHETN